MTPAEEHRWVSGEFTRRVEGVRPEGWDAPSPVREWKSRDVVRHLIEWSAAFLKNGAAVDLTSGPSVDDDPAGCLGRSLTVRRRRLRAAPAERGQVDGAAEGRCRDLGHLITSTFRRS